MTPLTGPLRGRMQTAENTRTFIKKIWIPEIKQERLQRLDMMSSCRSGFKESLSVGDSFTLPTIGRMYARRHVPGVPTTYDDIVPGSYDFRITRNSYTAHIEHNWLAMMHDYNLRGQVRRLMAYALAEDANNYILGMRAAPGVQHIYNTSDGTPTGTPLPLNEASILTAKELLRRALSPDDVKMYIAVEHYTQLATIERFSSDRYVNNKPVVSGEIGSIHNIRVIQTNNIIPNNQTITIRGANNNLIQSPAPGVLGSHYLPDIEDAPLVHLPVTNGGGNPQPFITAMVCCPDWAWFQMRLSPTVETAYDMDYQAWKSRSGQVYGGKSYFPEDCVLIHTAV